MQRKTKRNETYRERERKRDGEKENTTSAWRWNEQAKENKKSEQIHERISIQQNVNSFNVDDGNNKSNNNNHKTAAATAATTETEK